MGYCAPATWRWAVADRPHIRVDPAQAFGQPAVAGVPAESVGGTVWVESVAVAAHDYDLTRGQVLVACWFLGTQGPRKWRTRWKTWATAAGIAMWDVRTCDYDAVPDPPGRDR